MVARGHSAHDLLTVYPISMLKAMSIAARHNHREDHMLLVQATATAVLHGIDVGFNKGKAKLLKKYIDSLYRTNRSKDAEDTKKKFQNFFATIGKKNG